MSRLADLLDRLASHGALECLWYDGRAYTYDELLAAVAEWRPRFAQQGLQPGDVLALRADYSLQSAAALLAGFAEKLVVALIPRDRAADRYLVDAHASVLLDIDDAGAHRWQGLLKPGLHPLLEELKGREDGGLVIFTSGSSGAPKAAVQSVERFLAKFRDGKRLRTLAFLLFDHVAGMDTLFYTFFNGGCLVVTRSRTPGSICALIDAARVEVLPASPSFLRLLILAGDAGNANLSSLKVITYGSEPMDPSTLARLNERFPQLQITQKYGTTETGSPRSVSRGNDSLWVKLSSKGMESKVVDGILHLRGEATILGYLNAPSPIDAEGWYCTGDLVDVDGEWLRFRGRQSDTINVGGEKVAPAEVEQVILTVDSVQEAVVSGEPHAMMGNIVVARVNLRPGSDQKTVLKAIRLRCRERLAPYKIPVKIQVEQGSLVSSRHKAVRRAVPDEG